MQKLSQGKAISEHKGTLEARHDVFRDIGIGSIRYCTSPFVGATGGCLQFPKTKRYESKDYLAYIRTLACIVCGRGSIPHHWKSVGSGGSDLTAVPLCPDHHTLAGDSFHVLGVDTFSKRHSIDIDKVRIMLLEKYIEGRED